MFIHDLTKPVYLLLHGLNGGSQEEFIKDMVRRRREEGSTVVVMIARGMMDTHLVTWNTFHGARTGDVDAAARVLRKGLTSLADAHNIQKRQILAGVGYSTGESVSSLVSFYVFMLMGLLIACIQKRLFDFETSVAEKTKFSFG